MKDTSFFDTTSTLLVNGSKKEVLLKNTLVENITQLLHNTQKLKEKSMIDTVDTTISEMKELSPKVYADGLSLLKQYYYITIFSHFSSKDSLSAFS